MRVASRLVHYSPSLSLSSLRFHLVAVKSTQEGGGGRRTGMGHDGRAAGFDGGGNGRGDEETTWRNLA